MPKSTIFLLLIFLGLFGSPAASQAPTTTVASLVVDIWPDYDRPAVLILLTGMLPANIPLPAEVTVPIPAEADLNAIARIDVNNIMADDVEFTRDEDSVTFSLPNARFRVEYYVPYSSEGDVRSYTFNWIADLNVSQLTTTVQQPLAATDILINPEAVSVAADRGDGLIYHTLPTQVVPAGQPYAVTLQYTMPTPQLSAFALQAENAQPAQAQDNPFLDNWVLWLGGLGLFLVAIALTWQLADRRRAKPRKPQPVRKSQAARKKAASFCHQCGQKAEPADRFCRKCGTPLKQK